MIDAVKTNVLMKIVLRNVVLFGNALIVDLVQIVLATKEMQRFC